VERVAGMKLFYNFMTLFYEREGEKAWVAGKFCRLLNDAPELAKLVIALEAVQASNH
jgi:hypothetical protein